MMGIACRTGFSTAVAAIIVSLAIVAAAVAAPKSEAFSYYEDLPSSQQDMMQLRVPADGREPTRRVLSLFCPCCNGTLMAWRQIADGEQR
jgi:hypothetical protein